MSTETDMKKRVALFRNIEYDGIVVFPRYGDSDDETPGTNYVRVSAWLDIEFPSLTNEQMAGAALAAIAEQRAKIVSEFTAKLAHLDELAANFRALSAPSTGAA